MKKINLLTWTLIGSVALLSSCSKDDDHADHCDSCHITIEGATGADSLAWHVTDANGEDIVFCGDDLHEAEESLTITTALSEENGGASLPAGTYTHEQGGYAIHCHED